AWAALTVSCAAANVRYASAVAAATSNWVRFRVASDRVLAEVAAETLARRRPKSNGSHVTSVPTALPQTVPKLFVPRTGPEMEGSTPCGNIRPNVLFRVARLNCARESTRGRYAVRARSMPAAAAFTCS